MLIEITCTALELAIGKRVLASAVKARNHDEAGAVTAGTGAGADGDACNAEATSVDDDGAAAAAAKPEVPATAVAVTVDAGAAAVVVAPSGAFESAVVSALESTTGRRALTSLHTRQLRIHEKHSKPVRIEPALTTCQTTHQRHPALNCSLCRSTSSLINVNAVSASAREIGEHEERVVCDRLVARVLHPRVHLQPSAVDSLALHRYRQQSDTPSSELCRCRRRPTSRNHASAHACPAKRRTIVSTGSHS